MISKPIKPEYSQKEISERNRNIALFAGAKERKVITSGTEYTYFDFRTYEGFLIDIVLLENLDYHVNWNSLMAVIENTLEDRFKISVFISANSCIIYSKGRNEETKMPNWIIEEFNDSKLTACWLAVARTSIHNEK